MSKTKRAVIHVLTISMIVSVAILLFLKITGNFTQSWLWVFSPCLIPVLILFVESAKDLVENFFEE